MLIKLIYPTTSTALQLIPNFRRAPKLQVLDTGLINYFAGLQDELFRTAFIDTVYEGKIAEHIVGQELIAQQKSWIRPLVFWAREKKQSSAEIDYLIPFENFGIPIEVKSGTAGKLRSLRLFMEKVNHPYAIRIYSGLLKVDKLTINAHRKFHLLNLPFYLTGELEKYINWFINKF